MNLLSYFVAAVVTASRPQNPPGYMGNLSTDACQAMSMAPGWARLHPHVLNLQYVLRETSDISVAPSLWHSVGSIPHQESEQKKRVGVVGRITEQASKGHNSAEEVSEVWHTCS